MVEKIMATYDIISGIVTQDISTAVITDVSYPSSLYTGETGHVTGIATNTGSTELILKVSLVDVDTQIESDATGYISTIPQAPMFAFDLAFVMPNRNYIFELRLYD